MERTKKIGSNTRQLSVIAAIHAGDLFTLFVWWEATAITSVFLILAGKTSRSYKSAMRYILIQVASGMFLLSGAVILLSTDEEINQKYHKYMKPYLARSYKIEYDEKINGSKSTLGYFFDGLLY